MNGQEINRNIGHGWKIQTLIRSENNAEIIQVDVCYDFVLDEVVHCYDLETNA